MQVSTLRALELREDGAGRQQLQGRLRLLPGPVQDLVHFAREHSWRALFAGLRPAVVATATSQGVYHAVYSALRQLAVVRQRSLRCTLHQQPLHAVVAYSAAHHTTTSAADSHRHCCFTQMRSIRRARSRLHAAPRVGLQRPRHSCWTVESLWASVWARPCLWHL